MLSFNEFIQKYKLKYKATSNLKIQSICKDVDMFLNDGSVKSDIRMVNLHLTKGTKWVVYNNQNYFDSYGCSAPKKLFNFIVKQNGHCFFSEYKIKSLRHIRDAYRAAFCLHRIYSTKVRGMVFKSAVLKLYYQAVS